VALFKRNDSHHERAVAWFREHRGPILTTDAVITEAWHLVSQSARVPLVRFTQAACRLAELDAASRARVLGYLERYADLPLDYADATLLALAETSRVLRVATIDRDDFAAVRLANGAALTLDF
jgi:hypothetical protein